MKLLFYFGVSSLMIMSLASVGDAWSDRDEYERHVGRIKTLMQAGANLDGMDAAAEPKKQLLAELAAAVGDMIEKDRKDGIVLTKAAPFPTHTRDPDAASAMVGERGPAAGDADEGGDECCVVDKEEEEEEEGGFWTWLWGSSA